ncbi:MAG TPA: hypothetical protein IAC03_03245 [Candidatus Coprenecus pullistercoris]|nr:hypothetical protein [Candidatus Coprenecus pullistercoris]
MAEQNTNSNNPFGDLFSSIKGYIDLRIDEIKLALAENLAKIFSRIIFFFLFFILIGVVLGILASALSSWLGVLTGDKTIGLLITAGVFVLIILVLYLFKDRFLINSPLRMFLRMFFDHKKDGKEQ